MAGKVFEQLNIFQQQVGHVLGVQNYVAVGQRYFGLIETLFKRQNVRKGHAAAAFDNRARCEYYGGVSVVSVLGA